MTEERIIERSETELVLEARQGSEEAFAKLVRRYMEKAIELAAVTVGNYEDARDISQEAFVKAHRSLNQFGMRSKFSTWFYRILMNTAKDFLKKKKWQKFLLWKSEEGMENFFEMIPDHRGRSDKNILGEELGSEITKAIQRLPFQQRWIFTLRFLEDFSIQQICETTRLSEGTVKSTLHFSVQKFKRQLLPYIRQGGERL